MCVMASRDQGQAGHRRLRKRDRRRRPRRRPPPVDPPACTELGPRRHAPGGAARRAWPPSLAPVPTTPEARRRPHPAEAPRTRSARPLEPSPRPPRPSLVNNVPSPPGRGELRRQRWGERATRQLELELRRPWSASTEAPCCRCFAPPPPEARSSTLASKTTHRPAGVSLASLGPPYLASSSAPIGPGPTAPPTLEAAAPHASHCRHGCCPAFK